MVKQSARMLTDAFVRMTPEQRLQFFNETFNEGRKQSLALSHYRSQLMAAENADQRSGGLKAFLADDNNFGKPLAERLPIMEKFLSAEDLAAVDKALGPNADPAERALRIFKKIDRRQHDRFYEETVSPERKTQYMAEYFENSIRRGSIGDLLLNNTGYQKGKTWIDGVEVMEKLMDPQLVDETVRKIESLVPPQQDPNRTFKPDHGRIEELRAGISPEDPQAQEKQALLDRADQILIYPTEDYRQHLDRKTDTIARQQGLQTLVDGYIYTQTTRFLGQAEGGKYLDKLPHAPTSSGYVYYDPVTVIPAHRYHNWPRGVDLNDQEFDAIKNFGKGPMNPDSRQAILDIVKCFEEIGEKKYWVRGVVGVVEGSEQGDKKYAFWPLVIAKKNLADAVQEGDFDKIRASAAEYDRCKAITDKMMEAANRVSKDPIFCGNLNSTREELDHISPNPMPTEYLEDYAGHSRVNGVFLLYALSKNTGVPVERILDDPAGVMQELAEKHLNDGQLSSQKGKPIGARLVHGFDEKLQTEKKHEWDANQGFLVRALSTAAGFLPTDAERIRQAGQIYGALAAANYAVGRENVLWQALAQASQEKKQIVTQLAMLLPEEEFDLIEAGKKLGQEDWSKQLDPVSAIKRLQKEGKLDYSALVDRSKQILTEADAALPKEDADRDPTRELPSLKLYQKAALRNYHQIMRTVPPEQRQGEGYKKMAAHAVELQDELIRKSIEEDDSFGQNRETVNEQIRRLETEKTGWFLSSENSPEYTRMVKRVKLFNLKLDMLSGKEVTPESTGLNAESLEKFRKADTADLWFAARRAC